MKFFLKFFLVLFFLSTKSFAGATIFNNEVVRKNLSGYHLIGSNNLKVFGFNVYQISLWSEDEKFSYDKKFAININYKRKFSAEDLVERSIEEIKRINQIKDKNELELYRQKLTEIFRSVNPGDSKTAFYSKNEGLLLFFNGKLVGKISDPKLARYFVDIWLSDKSSYPKMTRAILGKSEQ